MRLFDTHTHLNFESFDIDREDVIKFCVQNGIVGMINAGCDVKTTADSIALAEMYPFIYATAGIHPEYASEVTEEDITRIRLMAINKQVVALGEFGLDYYHEPYDKEKQLDLFRKQMELAKKIKKPVMLHIREAYDDAYEVMKEFPEIKGVVHCFSADMEFAKKAFALGYYIALGGVLTYSSAPSVQEVGAKFPLNRIILETDCPFLAPDRKSRNTPMGVKPVFLKLCELRKESPNIIEEQLLQNVCDLFGLKLKKFRH